MNKHSEWGKLGAEVIKNRYIQLYYNNPNYCLECGSLIEIKEGQIPSEVRKKKFCDHSCAAKYNNKKYPKRSGQKYGECKNCGEQIKFKKQKKGGYSPRKYCSDCLKTVRVEHANSSAWHDFPPLAFEEQSKAEVKRRNHDARLWWSNRINSHARKVYKESGKPYVCNYCGYSLHVDICHIKDIKEFPDEALVKDINDPNNLVALCKNHHWEFDNGYLDIKN